MTARIHIHPLCVPPGQMQDSMQETLMRAGFEDLMIGPPTLRGFRELVRKTGEYEYTRMDGTSFTHGEPVTPEAA